MADIKSQDDFLDDSTDSFSIHQPDRRYVLVNYIHFTRALSLRALLEGDDELPTGIPLDLAEQLIDSQAKSGEWRSKLAPRQTPTYMLMDGCLAMAGFIQRVAELKPSLLVIDDLAELRQEITSLRTEVDHQKTSISRLEQRINTLVAFDSLAEFFRNYRFPIAAVLLIWVGYFFWRPNLTQHRVTDYFAVGLSLALFIIRYVVEYVSSRRNRRE